MAKQVNHEAVQDLLNTEPHWLIRHGITLLLVWVLLLLCGSHYVLLPDVMTADARVISCDTLSSQGDYTLRLQLSACNLANLREGQTITLRDIQGNKATWEGVIVGAATPATTHGEHERGNVTLRTNKPPHSYPIYTDNAYALQAEVIIGTYRLDKRLFNPFKQE